jgi:hypothetical protein
MLAAITSKPHELASTDVAAAEHQNRLAAVMGELSGIEADIAIANNNFGRARTEDEYAVILEYREKLKARAAELSKAVCSQEMNPPNLWRSEDEIAKALQLLHRLTELAEGAKTLGAVGELLRLVNARLFQNFASVQSKKRIVRRVAGGAVTFGSAPSPIEIYAGRTDRAAVKLQNAVGLLPANWIADGSVSSSDSHPMVANDSIGNVNRDERR